MKPWGCSAGSVCPPPGPLTAEPTLFSFADIARREPAASTAASTAGKSDPHPASRRGPVRPSPRPPWTASQRPQARRRELHTPRALRGRAAVPGLPAAPLQPHREEGAPGSSWGVSLQAGAHLVPSGPQRPAGPGYTEAPCSCGCPCAPCWAWRWACTVRGPSPSHWPSRTSRPGSSPWSCACGTASCSSDGAQRQRDSRTLVSTPAARRAGRPGLQTRRAAAAGGPAHP